MPGPQQARVGVSVVFAVCGAGFATWAARVPAAQQQLDLSPGQLAVGLLGLAAGSVAALILAGPLVTTIGSRAGSLVGALILCAGLPLGYFAFSITMIAVRLVTDRTADRVGPVLITRISAGLTVCGFLLAVTTTNPILGVLAFAVIGLGVSAIVPLAWSSAAKKEAPAPGRAIAAVATCGYLGFLVGPVLVGALATAIGLAPAVLIAGALAVIVVALAPSLRIPTASTERTAP